MGKRDDGTPPAAADAASQEIPRWIRAGMAPKTKTKKASQAATAPASAGSASQAATAPASAGSASQAAQQEVVFEIDHEIAFNLKFPTTACINDIIKGGLRELQELDVFVEKDVEICVGFCTKDQPTAPASAGSSEAVSEEAP